MLGIIKIDDIGSARRVIPFLHEIALLVLERRRHIHLAADPQEQGARVFGQAIDEVSPKAEKVEAVGDNYRRHARPSFGSENSHAEHVGLYDAGISRHRLGDLGRGHVLALPAKGITNAVHEVEEAPFVLSHQIAGAEPGIALLEYVAQDLRFRILSAGVPLEPAADVGLAVGNLADRFANLIWHAGNATTVGVANRLGAFDVEANQRGRKAMCEERGNSADRSGLAVRIVKREVAFRRGVEFQDPRNLESVFETVPHVRPQAVAATQPDPVSSFARMVVRIHEVATKLPDILKQRTVPA